MGDRIKRDIRLKGLSIDEANIEKLDTLNDLVVLYKKQIKTYLNGITLNLTLQKQIKSELGIK